jgi:catechol 2,3-dioxygenase-like lactoylglutathione lyase family enzyme
MITGIAHTAVCVPDLDEAVHWYTTTLGLEVLMPPVLMKGEALERDMGELVPRTVLRGAILGFAESGDRVLEVLEYPEVDGRPRPADASVTDHGYTHIGLVCDDIAKTRAELEARGVEFLTRGVADIVGLKTTWLRDRFGLIYILMEKSQADRPYYQQGY